MDTTVQDNLNSTKINVWKLKRKLNMTKEVRFLIIINSYKYLFYFDLKIGKT